jgi:hypothetical protein
MNWKAIRSKLRFTSRWRLRCLSCGRTRDGSEVGMVRVALPFPAWRLAICTQCKSVRVVKVEPVEEGKGYMDACSYDVLFRGFGCRGDCQRERQNFFPVR